MDIRTANHLLDEEQQWVEATAEHIAEHATWDSQTHTTQQQANDTLFAIQRNRKRLQRGMFGQCERCKKVIPDERLKIILTMADHYCAACAFELHKARTTPGSTHKSDTGYAHSQPAAYAF